MRTMRLLCLVAVLMSTFVAIVPAQTLDLPSLQSAPAAMNLLTDSAASPSNAFLFSLDARFAADTASGGGKGFASWFAEDAVLLANGKAPVTGLAAIAASATWKPSDYQLTWTATQAAMGPSGDLGYTWGHYDGRSKDASGNEVLVSGRYLAVWRRERGGDWKVVLNISNDEPAGAGDCCRLPPGI